MARDVAARRHRAKVADREHEISLSPPGAHDLGHLLDDVAITYFGQALPCSIVWCDGLKKRRRLAEYRMAGDGEIAIASWLNSKRVPRYLIEYLIHHELCHRALFLACGDLSHGDDFAAIEARYRHHARALAWVAKHTAC